MKRPGWRWCPSCEQGLYYPCTPSLRHAGFLSACGGLLDEEFPAGELEKIEQAFHMDARRPIGGAW